MDIQQAVEAFSKEGHVFLSGKNDRFLKGDVYWDDGAVCFCHWQTGKVVHIHHVIGGPENFEFHASMTDLLYFLGYVEEPWRDPDDLCLSGIFSEL